MLANTQYKPGTLVTYRNRDWMVLPSDDDEILTVKPLGGSEEEVTGIYLPLASNGEKVSLAEFPEPQPSEIGSFETAKILFNASRLSFRNAAGPFRCMGKLSFRPRTYQLVPLVMALKQETVRLMIADDVGIGKTIEALLILKELMERGEIKRFAIICPPHLCEQWQQELKEKLDIDAEIIRSSTAAQLDRRIPDDQSAFHHFPYQVISIDYIKADKRRNVFVTDCPEFVIVDEAHTCTLPEGATSKTQQQRYNLIHDIAAKQDRHLLLLTATPHSGKDKEFTSLLGLLKPEFNDIVFERMDESQRKKVAKHFILRKRENIIRWLNEDTLFPKREAKEIGYALSMPHLDFYQDLVSFARGISADITDNDKTKMLRSWAAVALIKGAMSSPAMAVDMLERRKEKLGIPEDMEQPSLENTLFDEEDFSSDYARTDLLEMLEFKENEANALQALQDKAADLLDSAEDNKIKTTAKLIKEWLKAGDSPIIFCHYISTAKHLAAILKKELGASVTVEAITSELADEQRKEKVEILGNKEKKVLVATDCLSEGINLQEYFTAVLHYDLPWNPNRIEQREGRVDRFGQTAELIKTYVLFGEDNPMDEFIMEVLIHKVNEIKKATGVTIPIGDGNKSLMTEAAKRILYSQPQDLQTELFAETKEIVSNELEKAREKGLKLRSIFAHETVDPELIRKDLEEVDEAIGDKADVENFVVNAVAHLGAVIKKDGQGFLLQTVNLPKHIGRIFKGKDVVKISFESPTPKGYTYIGRNHSFVEQLCQFMVAMAFEEKEGYGRLARVCEVQTDTVETKTTLVMFRVRNVIKEAGSRKESVAEEMYLWGYKAKGEEREFLDYKEGKRLLMESSALSNLAKERQMQDIENEMKRFNTLKPEFLRLAEQRADKLVDAHSRFKELIGGRRFEKATPVLPPDVMGVYILIPKPAAI